MAFYKMMAAFVATCLFALTHSQRIPTNEWSNATVFPNEDVAFVTDHLTQAEHLATDPRIYQYFMDQCIVQQVFPELFSMPSAFVAPFKAFHNFYFIGHTGVSAWAYDTGDGLMIIDTLNNQDEVDAVMLPMLAVFGFQGEDIKSVIISHEHGDHYGGAKYLQDGFGPAVYASEAAWNALAAMPANTTPPVPTRDQTPVDGQDVTLGNITFHNVATDVHTQG
jgi:metallo-beta-lactamase class B